MARFRNDAQAKLFPCVPLKHPCSVSLPNRPSTLCKRLTPVAAKRCQHTPPPGDHVDAHVLLVGELGSQT